MAARTQAEKDFEAWLNEKFENANFETLRVEDLEREIRDHEELNLELEPGELEDYFEDYWELYAQDVDEDEDDVYGLEAG